MSNVIDFLERMGQDALLRHATGADLESALTAADIDPVVRAALLAEDSSRLEALLGATANICCMIHPPGEGGDDEEEDEDDDDFDDDDDEEEDDATKSQRLIAHGAVAQ